MKKESIITHNDKAEDLEQERVERWMMSAWRNTIQPEIKQTVIDAVKQGLIEHEYESDRQITGVKAWLLGVSITILMLFVKVFKL